MEESNLVKFFGNTPFVCLLDTFIDNIGESYTKKEIQELSGLSKATLFKHWPKLDELNVLKITRVIGKTKLYTLNKENSFVKEILRFELQMIQETSLKKQLILAKGR